MEQHVSSAKPKETDVCIPVTDSTFEIHGVLRGEYDQPLVILAPGLGGWMHDLILFNASRYFEKEGIATLRVSFYGDDGRQRNIGDFDVKTNAADIDTITDYARQNGSKWMCVIGHSYSGMAIVYSQKQAFDAAVLWDASHTDGYTEPLAKQNLEKDFLYVPELDSYVSAHGSGYVLSRKVFEDYAPGSTAMARAFKVPTLIVNAKDSGEVMRQFGQDYTNSIDAKTKHIVIPGASHPFTEDGAMEWLYEVTTTWIKNQLT
jgi:dienelactone hydrolase